MLRLSESARRVLEARYLGRDAQTGLIETPEQLAYVLHAEIVRRRGEVPPHFPRQHDVAHGGKPITVRAPHDVSGLPPPPPLSHRV